MANDKKDTKTETKPKPDAVVVPPKGGAVAPYDYGDEKGGGFDGTTADDFAIPFIAVLQDLSPQIKKSKPEYIPGAEEGMLFNTVTGELYPTDEGVVIVPCCRTHVTVEWQPRTQGGGLVGMHDPTSQMVLDARKSATDFGSWKSPDGNDLMDTFYVYCLVLASADAEDCEGVGAVVAFSSTKIKKYKQFMSKLRMIKGSPPLFAFRLRLKALQDSNAKGDFFNFDVSPAIGTTFLDTLMPPDHPVFVKAAAFRDQVLSGALGADFGSQNKAGGDTPVDF